MTNERAFKLYLATRLHFLTKYDVFESNGRFKGQDKIVDRNDLSLIAPLVKIAPTPQELIQACAANFLYGNDSFLYEPSYAEDNYRHWQKVKQAITHCLDRDLGYIEFQLLKHNCTLDSYLEQGVISDLLSRNIEYETLIILNRKIPVIDKISGFEGDKYKVRMHKANKFVTSGCVDSTHSSLIDNFHSNIK